MDLRFLDQSSEVTPLLVRLYDNQRLYGLARDKKPEARKELTTAVVELLGMDLSPRESELIADVLIELMRQAEMDLRRALAARMAALENVPLRLILQIVNDEIEVASPVLRESPVLGEMDLAYIIKSKSAEYWRAIAERKSMSNKIVEMLADTRDLDTAVTLVKNENIHLSATAVGTLSDIAREFEDVAKPLLMRDEVDAKVAEMLYRYVGEELKSYIKSNFADNASDVLGSVDETVSDFVEETQNLAPEVAANDRGLEDIKAYSPYAPTKDMIELARTMKSRGLLGINHVVDTLRQGRLRAFIAQFSVYADLEIKTVFDILSRENGKSLAIVAKALGIVKSDFISIYLLTNRIRNEGKPVNLEAMNKAGSHFDSIKADEACKIMDDSLRQ